MTCWIRSLDALSGLPSFFWRCRLSSDSLRDRRASALTASFRSCASVSGGRCGLLGLTRENMAWTVARMWVFRPAWVKPLRFLRVSFCSAAGLRYCRDRSIFTCHQPACRSLDHRGLQASCGGRGAVGRSARGSAGRCRGRGARRLSDRASTASRVSRRSQDHDLAVSHYAESGATSTAATSAATHLFEQRRQRFGG